MLDLQNSHSTTTRLKNHLHMQPNTLQPCNAWLWNKALLCTQLKNEVNFE